MLADIRINPDNLLLFIIRIDPAIKIFVNMDWMLILFIYFFMQFFNFFVLVSKILYINTSISKILQAELGYTSAT